MKKHINLSTVFKTYAALLQLRADTGRSYSVLISDADKQDSTPHSYETYKEADNHVVSLNRSGTDAAVVYLPPRSKKPLADSRLFIKPAQGFGSFSRD